MEYLGKKRVKTGKKGQILRKMAKNGLHGVLWGSRFRMEKFFRLSCLEVSVGNKVSSKIYSNQANRMVASVCPQENTNLSLLDPVFPGVKFGSFFQNSYRSNDLTNS